MKKLFSMPLYLQGLKRARGAGVASTIVLLVLNVLPILTVWVMYITHLLVGSSKLDDVVVKTELAMVPSYIIILLAPVIVMRMFSFLNKRNSSDFFHAIPQKRVCVFLSFMAAAITWITVPVFVCGIMCFIGWNLVPVFSVGLFSIVRCVISYTALGLLSASCMAFAVMLTGNAFSGIFAYLNVLGLPFVVLGIYSHMVATVEETFVLERSVFRYIGDKGFLPVALGDHFFSPLSPAVILAYIAFVLLTVLACIAYVRRKSETAENSTGSRFLQHLLRCCSILPIWLFLGWIALEGIGSTWFIIAAIFIPVSVVIYVLYELITTRRLINVAKSLLVYIVVPVLSIALTLCALINALLIPLTNPKSADEVDYIVVSGDSYFYYKSRIYLPYQLVYGERIDDKDAINAATSNMRFEGVAEDEDDSFEELRVMLKLKNGRTVWRNAYINKNGFNRFIDALMANPKYKGIILSLPDYGDKDVRIDVTEKAWQIFKEEYNKLTDEQKLRVYTTAYGESDYHYISANIRLEDGKSLLSDVFTGVDDTINIDYYITETLLPQTYKYLEENSAW